MASLAETTQDNLFDGRLVCRQNKEGYRFSIDSVLLAHFALHWKQADILDLGCGNGILGLILLYRNWECIHRYSGIEYQQSLVELARGNMVDNALSSKAHICHGDYRYLRNYYNAEQFSHVICNPPFYRQGSGRVSKNSEAHIARHQVVSSTSELAKSISYVVRNRGGVAMVLPADCLTEYVSHLRKAAIEPKRMRPVYSYPAAESATLILLEGTKNGGEGLKVLPPLYVYACKNGEYSDEVATMYQPNQE